MLGPELPELAPEDKRWWSGLADRVGDNVIPTSLYSRTGQMFDGNGRFIATRRPPMVQAWNEQPFGPLLPNAGPGARFDESGYPLDSIARSTQVRVPNGFQQVRIDRAGAQMLQGRIDQHYGYDPRGFFDASLKKPVLPDGLVPIIRQLDRSLRPGGSLLPDLHYNDDAMLELSAKVGDDTSAIEVPQDLASLERAFDLAGFPRGGNRTVAPVGEVVLGSPRRSNLIDGDAQVVYDPARRGGYFPQEDPLALEDDTTTAINAMASQRASLPRSQRVVPQLPTSENPEFDSYLTWDQLQAQRAGGQPANQARIAQLRREGAVISGGSGEPPEIADEENPARGSGPGPARAYSTQPPVSVSSIGKWYTERAGLGHVPSDDEAENALNYLTDNAPAYQTMFMGQTAREDPEFNTYMTAKGRGVQRAHETLLANWHTAQEADREDGGNSRYKTPYWNRASEKGTSSLARLDMSRRIRQGTATFEHLQETIGTQGRDPVKYDDEIAAAREGLAARRAEVKASNAASTAARMEARFPASENVNLTEEQQAAILMDEARARVEAAHPSHAAVNPALSAAPTRAASPLQAAEAAHQELEPFLARARDLGAGSVTFAGGRNYLSFADPQQTIDFNTRAQALMSGNNNVGQNTHGPLGQIQRMLDPDGNSTGRMHFVKNGAETAGPEIYGKGLHVANAAVNSALGEGGFQGMSDDNIIATFRKRVNDYVYQAGQAFARDMGSQPDMKDQAKAIAQKVVEAASTLLSPVLREADEINGGSGSSSGAARNSVRLRGAASIQRMMDGNLTFRDAAEAVGGADALANGPTRVFEAEGSSFQVGGRGGGATSGRYSGRSGDEDFVSSIYRTPLGKYQMASYMAKMWWQQSAGTVLGEANTYGTEAARFAGMSSYGGGELSGVEISAARIALAQSNRNRNAYDQFGWINEAGYTLGGGPVGTMATRAGNDLGVALGAGGVAGMGMYALGAAATGLTSLGVSAGLGATLTGAAGPLGLAVAGGVAINTLGTDAINGAMGLTSRQGVSLPNMLRGIMVGGISTINGANQPVGDLFTRVGQDRILGRQGISSQEEQARAFSNLPILGRLGGPTWGYAFGDRFGKGLATNQDDAKFAVMAENVSSSLGVAMDDLAQPMAALQQASGDQISRGGGYTSFIKEARSRGMSAQELLSAGAGIATSQGEYFGTLAYKEAIQAASAQYKGDARGWAQAQSRAGYRNQLASQLTGYMGGATIQQALGVMDGLGLQTQQQVGSAAGIAAAMERGGTNIASDRAFESAIAPFVGMSLPNQQAVANSINRYTSVGGSSAEMSAFLQESAAGPILMDEALGGNQYAMADLARSGNAPSWMQMVDANGLAMGKKDFSGNMAYLASGRSSFGNITSGLTGGAALSAIGISDVGYQNALLTGGTRGLEDLHDQRSFNNSMASIGLQFQGIQARQTFNWGSGSWDNPAAGSMWALEDQQRKLQWKSQLSQFGFSKRRLDIQQGYAAEDDAADLSARAESRQFGSWARGFDRGTSLINRDNSREAQQYSMQVNAQNFGWNMEDLDENIRRSSGRDRSLLIRQRDRANVSENMRTGEEDRQKKAQEQLWAREDERYQKNEQHIKAVEKLEDEGFLRSRRQRDEMFALEREELGTRIKEAKAMHSLQEEMNTAQRKFQAEEIERQKMALGIQAQSLIEQREYQEAMKKVNRLEEDRSADWSKMWGYSGGIKTAMDSIMKLASLRVTITRGADGSVSISGGTVAERGYSTAGSGKVTSGWK